MMYRRTKIRRTADFSENNYIRRQWSHVSKSLEEKHPYQSRILYPANVFSKHSGGMKTFSNMPTERIHTSRPPL